MRRVSCAVYVPINQQTSSSDFKNRDHVTLRFKSTARHEEFNEPEPLWKLKITQLECPHTQTSWLKIKDIARQVWDWEEEVRDVEDKSKYSLGNVIARKKNDEFVVWFFLLFFDVER